MGIRRWQALVIVAGLGLTLAGVGLAAAAAVGLRAAAYPTLGGAVLVDSGGRPLYHFTTEKGKAIKCTGACATTWPPVILAKGAKATAGTGLSPAKVGAVVRPDGRRQATYAGFALYRYAGDVKGTAKGQGLGKSWYVIGANGRIVTRQSSDPDDGADPGTTQPDPGQPMPGGGGVEPY